MLEQDRYQQNPKLYVFGMVMLMLFWFFTLITIYIIPFLIWNLNYNVPETIIAWQLHLEDTYQFSLQLSKLLTFLTVAVPALICMIVSWIISAYIDKQIVETEMNKDRTSMSISEGPQKKITSSRPVGQEVSFASKIILIILIAVVLLFVIQWLISVPPPATS